MSAEQGVELDKPVKFNNMSLVEEHDLDECVRGDETKKRKY